MVQGSGVSTGYRVLIGVGIVLLVGGGAAVAADLLPGRAAPTLPPAPSRPQPATAPVPTPAPAPPATPAARAPDPAAAVTLTFDGRSFPTTWKALGLVADGKGGVALDRKVALEALVALGDSENRPATDAHVDLVDRKVLPETPGYGIHVYESIAALDQAARAGQTTVALAGAAIEPAVTVAKLGNLDIGHVMGWFETHYPPGERDRNYNLRLVAEHVNGHILMPGEVFSFNDIVGDRTEKQGYRVAHVIQAGEMIDGLAGGACQISSTLHAASWFAGLDIVKSTPHSRPSAYITMGMDATVVYPTTDLKLRNPYDFPVVIHYVVSQGTVRVEVLGRERPWDKIAFEREILKETPFETVTRDDDGMPVGSQLIEQVGFPGYHIIRRRVFYKGGQAVKTEKWDISYPPTTEYVRVGSNPDPNLAPPAAKEPHGLPSPGGREYVTAQ
jgi:vancomycin resistance protein YoaR